MQEDRFLDSGVLYFNYSSMEFREKNPGKFLCVRKFFIAKPVQVVVGFVFAARLVY